MRRVDDLLDSPSESVASAASRVRRGWTDAPVERAAEALRRQIAPDGVDFAPAFALMFISPKYPLGALEPHLRRVFGDFPVIGCTTAGEITENGYADGAISAVAFDRRAFALESLRIDGLRDFRVEAGAPLACDLVRRAEASFGGSVFDGGCFAMLLVDGSARQEEALVSTLSGALSGVPLFGGSAARGLSFDETFILHQGRFHRDAALLSLIRTVYPFQVFKLDHFEPTERKMVVTGVDPERRLVTEINAEPAAEEYARLVGIDPALLSPFVFAAHPVLVRVGGEHHVRAIQRVEPDGSLLFYCAIDEGLVLTAARARNIVSHLQSGLDALRAGGPPPVVTLGFDCVLRRLEAEQSQSLRPMSEILRRANTVGFSTYGEQYRAMHVNQTLTGVMIFPPESGS